MKNNKVLCAMSGGIDSSVSAALLKKQGYKVTGFTFKLFRYAKNKQQKKNCCFLEAIDSARQVCKKLNIPHYVIDISKKFEKEIIQNFITEYLAGRTPNPCVRCNQLIKFPTLISYAQKLGIDFVATGHYAKKLKIKNSKLKIIYKLLKAEDSKKDQSYFLWGLTQKDLKYIIFPLGDYKKTEVRELAKKFNLSTAERPESQDVCFINKNYFDFLKSKIRIKKFKSGPILNSNGNKIGDHKGLPFYTIGQRKGLGGGKEKPVFVTKIDVENNAIIIGEEKDLYNKKCIIKNVNFISGIIPKLPLTVKSRVRYNMKEDESEIKIKNSKFIIEFKKAQRAITLGQSLVFYKRNEVLGGGIIDKVF